LNDNILLWVDRAGAEAQAALAKIRYTNNYYSVNLFHPTPKL
jgi:hypothetical protein